MREKGTGNQRVAPLLISFRAQLSKDDIYPITNTNLLLIYQKAEMIFEQIRDIIDEIVQILNLQPGIHRHILLIAIMIDLVIRIQIGTIILEPILLLILKRESWRNHGAGQKADLVNQVIRYHRKTGNNPVRVCNDCHL